jgi:hypothetical protein
MAFYKKKHDKKPKNDLLAAAEGLNCIFNDFFLQISRMIVKF